MSRIVLLGATGFVGSNLLFELEKQNFQVYVMIHKKSPKIPIKHFLGNITTPKKLDSILKKDDVVINLIGQISKNQTDFIQTNILGAINLLESCKKKKVKKVIFLSSINVYGENSKTPSLEKDPLKPFTLYGQIKLLSEEIYKSYAKNYGLNVTLLRLSNIYGPNKKSGFVANLINSLNNKKITNVAYNQGKQYRDLLFIDDAVTGIISAIKDSKFGLNVYNLSSGKRYSINKIIQTIEQLSGKKVNIQYSNIVPDEKCIWANPSKARKKLNFSPTFSLEKGLHFTIKS